VAIALYYPWMHFQDDTWVKLAVLTWDRVARVHPPELPSRDSELVRRIQDESDFVLEIAPSHHDLDVVATTFAAVLDPDVVDRHLERSRRTGYLMPPSNAYSWQAPEMVWIYQGETMRKVSTTMAERMLELELARPHATNQRWIAVPSTFASIYLAVLADAMGHHNDMSPVTDDPRVHRASGSMEHLMEALVGTGPAPAVDNAPNAYLHVAIQAVLEPKGLAEVPVSKILKFRQRHGAELVAFRTHVAGLGEELARVAEVENLTVAQAHLQALYTSRTKPMLDDLRKALRGFGIESAAGSLGLRVDLNAATGTVLGGIAAAGGQLALAGAAVAVGVVPYVASRVRARKQHKASPVAYLLAADRELTGSRLLRAMRL
jgi:hypothetical protein